MDFENLQPELEYPCAWSYRVIGEDADRLRQAIAHAVGGSSHTITPANTSRTGRYLSLEVEVQVESEEHRHAVLHQLQTQEAVRMVL